MYVEHLASGGVGDKGLVDWTAVLKLIKNCNIDLKPVHLNDPLGSDDNGDEPNAPDYIQLQTARLVLSKSYNQNNHLKHLLLNVLSKHQVRL